MKNLRNIFLLTFLASAIIALFGYKTIRPIFNNRAEKNKNETLQKNNNTQVIDALPIVTFINPIRGNKNAKISIVEYGDYQCPFCATVEETLKKLLNEYKNDLKIVWKDFPIPRIHPLSEKLAIGARCAQEQGQFWEFHDELFTSQDSILSETDILRIGEDLELEKSFQSCYEAGKMKPRVEADFEEGARLGVNGAPYFFVGKERLSGAVSYEKFKEAIDRELGK